MPQIPPPIKRKQMDTQNGNLLENFRSKTLTTLSKLNKYWPIDSTDIINTQTMATLLNNKIKLDLFWEVSTPRLNRKNETAEVKSMI